MSRTIKEALDNYCEKLTGSKPDGTCICDSLEALGGASGKSKTIAATIDAMAAAGFGAQNVVFGEVSGQMATTAEGFAAYVTELVIPEGVTKLVKSGDGEDYPLYFDDFTNLRKITLPSTMTMEDYVLGESMRIDELVISEGVTEVGWEAFCDGSFTKVSLPSTLKTIGTSAFNGCKLVSVEIPNGAESIECSFQGCVNLQSVTMPNTVQTIDQACFGNCPALKTITVNAPENSIAGAPWGAENAEVIWTG